MKPCCYAPVLAPMIDVPCELAVRNAAIRIDSINQFIFYERLPTVVLPRHSLVLRHVICDNDLRIASSVRFVDVRPKWHLCIGVKVSFKCTQSIRVMVKCDVPYVDINATPVVYLCTASSLSLLPSLVYVGTVPAKAFVLAKKYLSLYLRRGATRSVITHSPLLYCSRFFLVNCVTPFLLSAL